LKRFTPRHLVIAISFLAIFAISAASFGQSKNAPKQQEQPQQQQQQDQQPDQQAQPAERTDVYHDLEIFTKILEKVSQNYVTEVDTHKLMKKAIDGMLSELDPHSQYLDGLDYEDLMVSTRGEFGGLGMLISFRDNYPTVMSPIDGTPAERAGIRGGNLSVVVQGEEYLVGGDVLTSIDNTPVRTHQDYLAKVKTLKPGQRTRITILRDGQRRELSLTVGERPRLPSDLSD